MNTTDEDLAQFEKDLRQFKIEYEQFFGGGRKRPPSDTEWRLEQVMRRYGDRGAEMSFAQRFRYNNLTQTYAKYRDIFRKRLKKREEGTVDRHFGAAAKQIEAERAAGRAGDNGAAEKKEAALCVVLLSNPEQEQDKVEVLFRALQRARKEAGEKEKELSARQFRDFIRKKTQQFRKSKPQDEVEYAVFLENGRVRLKARMRSS